MSRLCRHNNAVFGNDKQSKRDKNFLLSQAHKNENEWQISRQLHLINSFHLTVNERKECSLSITKAYKSSKTFMLMNATCVCRRMSEQIINIWFKHFYDCIFIGVGAFNEALGMMMMMVAVVVAGKDFDNFLENI